MATLEELIAAQQAQAAAESNLLNTQYEQRLKEGNAALDTEAAEISPLYDKLIGETQQAYTGNISKARESASEAGVYRSGLRYNKELQIGAQAAQQTGEYAGERTRKLADIARRRTLLRDSDKMRAAELGKIQAGLGATVADIRYKDYQMQEQAKLERERMAASAASKASEKLTADQYAAELIASGMEWGDIANLVESRYGKIASGSNIDQMLRKKFIGAETNYVAPTQGRIGSAVNAARNAGIRIQGPSATASGLFGPAGGILSMFRR